MPDDSFDYDEFVKREFNEGGSRSRGLHWFWWLIAVLVLAGIIWLGVR